MHPTGALHIQLLLLLTTYTISRNHANLLRKYRVAPYPS